MSPLDNGCERRVHSDIALDAAAVDINRLASGKRRSRYPYFRIRMDVRRSLRLGLRFGMGLDSKKDVHLAGSSGGPVSRLEVLQGPSGRRVRSEAERARIVAESLLPGAQVSEVARKHGATRWQICDWRRRFRQRGMLAPCEASQSTFAPLVLESALEGGTFRRSSLRSRSATSCCGRTQPKMASSCAG
ncbi:transposase [Bradyrhizobium sp. WSM471]|nr:transposase [Bradyrhizobium sp. WSM471]